MKLSFSDLPLRHKQLWFEIILDFLLLAAFIAERRVWPTSKNPAVAILTLSYIVSILYGALKLRASDATPTDERDKIIKGRGQQAGYFMMTFGMWMILLYSSTTAFSFASLLLVLWLGSHILTNSVQLRIYAGHEAWWPDPLIARLHRRRDERLKSMRDRFRP